MKIITTNRKARHNYHILEKFEAGIVLQGSEVKSIRLNNSINITESYIHTIKNECWLSNTIIPTLSYASYTNHNIKRDRKLLLNSNQIKKLEKELKTIGITIIPLDVYFNNKNIVKLTIAIAKGKKLYDKRHDIKKKDIEKDTKRSIKNLK